MKAEAPPFDVAVVRCYGKRRFLSIKLARQATTRMLRSSGKQGWPYYCDICTGYHLTSQSPKTQKEMRHRRKEREEK